MENNKYNDLLEFSTPPFRPLPKETKILADHSEPKTPAVFAIDWKDETYWYSSYPSGNLRLTFERERQQISIVRLKTWWIRPILAKFEIYSKEFINESPWVEIGNKTVEVNTTSDKPQNIDINVNWGVYQILQIKCSNLPLISEILIYG